MPARPKAVFDTNVYLSAILFGGPPRICLELARARDVVLITSRAILLELASTLREKFRWSDKDISAVIVGISKFATIVRPQSKMDVIHEDPDDNRILEAALEGRADFIISGDKRHVLPLKTFEGIRILSAADFLKQY